jgi:hypothetical protein
MRAKRSFRWPLWRIGDRRVMFSVVRRLPNREDVGTPRPVGRRWTKPKGGNRGMLRCGQSERRAMGIRPAPTRLEALRPGSRRRKSAWSAAPDARWEASGRRLRIGSAVPSGVSGNKHKPSALGRAIPEADRRVGSESTDVITGRLAVRAARELRCATHQGLDHDHRHPAAPSHEGRPYRPDGRRVFGGFDRVPG